MTLADFDSQCGLCDERIREGDEIENVEGEWVHAQCARDEGYLDDRQ